MMKIVLAETPGWRSPYGSNGALVPLPLRMRRMHPDALASIDKLARKLIVTDVFRSPASSLEAISKKRGIKAPGYSAHNYGLALDLDVRACLRENQWKKHDLDLNMLAVGFRCFRADDAVVESEAWHYTWMADAPGSAAVEAVIQKYYGGCFALTPKQIQTALHVLHLYDGAIDGQIGPQSKRGLALFQRQWKLTESGLPSKECSRLLAVVTADVAPGIG